MSGRRVSGTSRRFPRHFLSCDFPEEMKEKDGKNLNSQDLHLALEVPDVLLPDIRDHPIEHKEDSLLMSEASLLN